MNRRPQGLEASKAVVGFLQYKGAEGLAPITVAGYERDLKLWIDHMGDIDVVRITPQHILSFLNYIREWSGGVLRHLINIEDQPLTHASIWCLMSVWFRVGCSKQDCM